MLDVHHAVSVVLAGRAEVHTVQLGVIVGLLGALLWPEHRDVSAALVVLSGSVALGRLLYPYGNGGLIVARPLYFFVPLGVSMLAGLSGYRMLRNWVARSAPGAVAVMLFGVDS